MMTEPFLTLGQSRRDAKVSLTLPLAALTRHWMALGSSGSGKTVLCKAVVEDCARQGIPVICVDPQGDLCSLALPAVPENAAPDSPAARYAAQVETVIFTPAARKGVPLCADPLQLSVADLPSSERVRVISSAAATLSSLLGYDLDSDDGEGLSAVLDAALTELHAKQRWPRNLAEFARVFATQLADDPARFHRYWDERKLEQALKRLARLDVGARRLLFHEGLALNIDLLLGRVGGQSGKTRISVIYLNTLNSQEDKEFFLATLADRLYAWMLQNPSPALQAVFYVDEIAPFIPPVRKPACKDALALLFKQARKYGIGCVMATQNPGDVDYKAMAQFGTWALGRLTTAQDLKKVQPTLKSLDPTHTDALMTELPAQKAGEFLLLSPDHYPHTERLRVRWLYSEHKTLDEDQLARLADARWRARFEALEANQQAAVEPAIAAATPVPTTPEPPGAPPPTGLHAVAVRLAERCSQSVAEFSDTMNLSEVRTRALLKQLQDAGLAGSFRVGRGLRYWALGSRLRPDLGLCAPVKAFRVQVQEAAITQRAEALLTRKNLGGWLTGNERLDHLSLEYRLSIRVHFREKVAKAFWHRLLGAAAHEERRDSVYLRPRDLHLLHYNPDQGIIPIDKPSGYASAIQDFDGVASIDTLFPAALRFDEREWQERPSDEQILRHFQSSFEATPESVEPVFIPVWVLSLRAAGGNNQRLLLLDALSGNLLAW